MTCISCSGRAPALRAGDMDREGSKKPSTRRISEVLAFFGSLSIHAARSAARPLDILAADSDPDLSAVLRPSAVSALKCGVC